MWSFSSVKHIGMHIVKATEPIRDRASRNDKTINILTLKISPFLIHKMTCKEFFTMCFYVTNTGILN